MHPKLTGKSLLDRCYITYITKRYIVIRKHVYVSLSLKSNHQCSEIAAVNSTAAKSAIVFQEHSLKLKVQTCHQILILLAKYQECIARLPNDMMFAREESP